MQARFGKGQNVRKVEEVAISVPDDPDDLEVAGARHDDGEGEHVDADGLLDGRLPRQLRHRPLRDGEQLQEVREDGLEGGPEGWPVDRLGLFFRPIFGSL